MLLTNGLLIGSSNDPPHIQLIFQSGSQNSEKHILIGLLKDMIEDVNLCINRQRDTQGRVLNKGASVFMELGAQLSGMWKHSGSPSMNPFGKRTKELSSYSFFGGFLTD